jgi:predicted dehydrogenase
MADVLEIALVGCGGMGRRHLAAYAELERAGAGRVRIAALCDTDAERREEARQAFAAVTGRTPPGYATLDCALGAGAIGATGAPAGVDLAVPTRLHHTLAIEAFEAGLHVFVEKPIALTVRAARAMTEAAERAGRVLAVSENFRRVPVNRAVRALIAGGAIGRPYWTVSELSIPAERLHPTGGGHWYRDKRMSGSLVALEMGVHECDLLAYWFGGVERVDAQVRTFETEVPGPDGRPLAVTSEDSCFARLELAGGVVANVTMTMAGHGHEYGRRHAVGSEGSLTGRAWEGWDDGELLRDGEAPRPLAGLTREWLDGLDPAARERLLPSGTFRPDDLSIATGDPLRYGVATAIADFARAALDGGTPEVGPPEATSALAAALALLESSVADRPVDVDAVLTGRVHRWQDEIDAGLGLLPENHEGDA